MKNSNGYHDRVNRVLDHVGQHLDGELSLAALASISGFSPFHFHRVFQAVTGETLNGHVRRVRLERAAALLKASPRRRITDVAMQAGFGGPAEFSRAFKSHFGRTASSWDRRSPLEPSKICKAPDTLSFYTLEELERWMASQTSQVVERRLGAFRYVYNRTFNSYGNERLLDPYKAVVAWLEARQTDMRDIVVIGMSLDDPSVTPSEKCRYDLGIAFPVPDSAGVLNDIIASRERAVREPSMPTHAECAVRDFSVRDFEQQRVAAFHCIGDLEQVGRAWQYLYRIWLPSHEVEPADIPAMEMFVRVPEEIGWETFDLQACIPVVPL